ncbi:MAG: hypothetical protein K1Y02_03715 [Candidatus Hydrogenedentes bacterium]|nr:hypothetical protein [Candidatus Hydrogenedentota bacterium]
MQRLVVTCVCGERIQVPRSAIGRTGLCPACERPITIRSQNATPARTQPAPRAVEVSPSVPVPASSVMPGPLAANRVMMAADDSKRRFSQAVDLYFNGRYAESLTLFDALVQEFPDLEEIKTGRALCLGALRKSPALALEHQPNDGRSQSPIRPMSGRQPQQPTPQAPPIPMPPPPGYAGGYVPAPQYEAQAQQHPYVAPQAPPVYAPPPPMQAPPVQPYVVHPQVAPQAYTAPPAYVVQPPPAPPSQQVYVAPQPAYAPPPSYSAPAPAPVYAAPQQAYSPPVAPIAQQPVPPIAPQPEAIAQHVPQSYAPASTTYAYEAQATPNLSTAHVQPIQPPEQVAAPAVSTMPPVPSEQTAPQVAIPAQPMPAVVPTPAESPVVQAGPPAEATPPPPKPREKLPLPDTLDEETFKRVLLDKMINGESDDIQLRATELAAKVFGYTDQEFNEELASMQRLLDSSEVTDYEFRLPDIKIKQSVAVKSSKQTTAEMPGEVAATPDANTEANVEGVVEEDAAMSETDVANEQAESDGDVPVAVQGE